METRAFQPLYTPSQGTTGGSLLPSVTVAATTTAAATATPFAGVLNNAKVQIQIANKSTTGWAHVNFGIQGSVTAATVAASYPVAPGGVVVVSVSPEVTGASVILDTGTGNVVFTRGEGL